MNHTAIAAAAGLVFLIAGCVQSLQPLYTSRTIITDSTLIGRWKDNTEENIWQFSPGEHRSYSLDYSENGSPASFEIHLVRIGGYRFVDFFPKEANIRNELYKTHLLPTHSFARLVQSGDTLKLSFLNHDWIKQMSLKKKLTISTQSVNGRYVLTAGTGQLQKFVLAYAGNPAAFIDPIILIRADR